MNDYISLNLLYVSSSIHLFSQNFSAVWIEKLFTINILLYEIYVDIFMLCAYVNMRGIWFVYLAWWDLACGDHRTSKVDSFAVHCNRITTVGHFCFELRNKIKWYASTVFGQIMEKPLTVNVTRNNTEILWRCHNRYPWNPILCLRRSNTRRTTILFATPTICMTSLSRGNDVLLNSVRQRCSSDTFYILRKIVRKTIIESYGTGRVQNCAQVGTVQQNRDKMSLPTGSWLGSLAFINIDWKKHNFNLLSGTKFYASSLRRNNRFIGSSLSSTQHSFSHIV